MGVLQYPTALATVQDALVNVIGLALGARLPFATLATLAAHASRGASGSQSIADKRLAYVTAATKVYRYSVFSTAAHDGSTVIKPNDAGTGPGRWLITSSTVLDGAGVALSSVSAGYLKRIMLWAGERSAKVWKERILGLRPAVVLQFTGETKEIRANQRGGLCEKQYHFSLWGVSQNLRADIEAEKGSPITAEAAADPGVARIMGDLEFYLDGLNGSQLGVDGLDFIMLGAAQPGIEDYDGREFVWTAPLDVRVTIGREDPDRQTLTDAYLQANDVQRHAQVSFDANNYVVSGLQIDVGAGFNKAPANGSAVIAGATVVVAGAPLHAFTASRATWRDLNPNGTFTYVESYTDDREPAVTSGALRVGVTLTDWAGVTEDRYIAATSIAVGPNNQILP